MTYSFWVVIILLTDIGLPRDVLMMNSSDQKMSDIDRSCDVEGDSDIKCEKAAVDVPVPGTGSTALAVVPYDDTKIGHFHRSQRQFIFDVDSRKHEIIIHQNWKELGVAAVVWDAAVVLCEYMAKNVHLVRDKRTIELGAGTGLVGIFAQSLGAQVTITDRRLALETIQKNVRSNNINIHEKTDSTASHEVRNGLETDESKSVVVRELSWGENLAGFPRTYDVIFGADIVYMEETFPDLIQTMKHLSSSQTMTIIAARIRYERDSNFFLLLRQTFTVDEVYHDAARNVTIFSARKLG